MIPLTKTVAVDTSAIDKMLAFSQDMLLFAKKGQWDSLAHCYRDRELLIRTFFALDINDKQTLVTNCLTEMLMLDGEVKTLVQANQAKVREELERLGQGRSANKAYLKVGNNH